MKIQTSAIIKSISIDGQSVHFENKSIALEFSAIDTGGGFKDPILDFSFKIDDPKLLNSAKKDLQLTMQLEDPQNIQNEATLSYNVNADISGTEINGRLKEDQLSRPLMGFVIQLLR